MAVTSVEYLRTQLRRAVLCKSATLPGSDLRKILDIASVPLKGSEVRKLRLQCAAREVTVSGEQIRTILSMALMVAERKRLLRP
jgi:hypothetical protein